MPEKKEEPKSRKMQEEIDDDEFKTKREVYNLSNIWIDVAPSKNDFITEIKHMFSEGLDAIQVIERWSKHQQFQPYVKGLEEWDEIIELAKYSIPV